MSRHREYVRLLYRPLCALSIGSSPTSEDASLIHNCTGAKSVRPYPLDSVTARNNRTRRAARG